MTITNRHQRIIAAAPEPIAALVADLDRIWPARIAPAPRLHGHRLYHAGPMRWEEHDRPGAARAFRVASPAELQGEHWSELAAAQGGTVLRHTLQGRAARTHETIWRERIEPLHDLILQALLDHAAAAAAAGLTDTDPCRTGGHNQA